jgi:3-methyladenine DNA glycosylase AlkC
MSEITFGTWAPAAAVNPYADAITKLAELNNDAAAITITVDADKAITERNKISKAANDIGKTARLRATVETKGEKGKPDTVSMTFTLTKRHKARRGVVTPA